jgi:hypothetical protein
MRLITSFAGANYDKTSRETTGTRDKCCETRDKTAAR